MAQTYENIELIVSDDYSQDNTLVIVRQWMNLNKDKFVKTKMIQAEKNSGTPANCNRGIDASSGYYIKLIAGDDILLNNCIVDNVNFCSKNNAEFAVSKLIYFNENGILDKYGDVKLIDKFFKKTSPKKKLTSYLRSSLFLNSPSYFYTKNLWSEVNKYDERFNVLEDNPFLNRVLLNDFDIQYFPEDTVKYRIHSQSATGSSSSRLQNDFIKYLELYVEPRLKSSSWVDYFYLLKYKFELKIKSLGLGRSIIFKLYKKGTYFLNWFS